MAKNIDIMGQIDIPGGLMKKGLSVLKCSQVFASHWRSLASIRQPRPPHSQAGIWAGKWKKAGNTKPKSIFMLMGHIWPHLVTSGHLAGSIGPRGKG